MTAKFCAALDSALIAIEAIDLNVGDIILQGQTYVIVEEINNHNAVPVRYFSRSIFIPIFLMEILLRGIFTDQLEF